MKRPVGPMPKRGNPRASTCRHCGEKRVKINGFLFCRVHDGLLAVDCGPAVVATWALQEKS